jgi:hypothetical protein
MPYRQTQLLSSAATHGEIVDGKETDRDQSDNESIATDEGDEFDFTAIKGCAQDALNAQKTARVFFELDQAAPKLEQLAVVLSGARMSHSDLNRAVGFVEKLEKLQFELARMIGNVVSDEPGKTSVKADPASYGPQLPETPRTNKQVFYTIMGPSPEKASKRRKSYGIH